MGLSGLLRSLRLNDCHTMKKAVSVFSGSSSPSEVSWPAYSTLRTKALWFWESLITV